MRLAEIATWLASTARAEAGAIHVATEVPHGPIVETSLEPDFKVYAINPKHSIASVIGGIKDVSRDAEVLAHAPRNDTRAFRNLALVEPLFVELCEWSRMTEGLKTERNRLWLREQLRRYFLATLELQHDLGAEWFLDLAEFVPTPDKAARIRETSGTLKSRRIRRCFAMVLNLALHC